MDTKRTKNLLFYIFMSTCGLGEIVNTKDTLDVTELLSCLSFGECSSFCVSVSPDVQHLSMNRKHVCAVCGAAFTRPNHVITHMRVHTGEKPFVCKYCGKQFSQRGSLKKHSIVHLNLKLIPWHTFNSGMLHVVAFEQYLTSVTIDKGQVNLAWNYVQHFMHRLSI